MALDPGRDDLPLLANTSQMLVRHYVLDLTVHLEMQVIGGCVVLFLEPGKGAGECPFSSPAVQESTAPVSKSLDMVPGENGGEETLNQVGGRGGELNPGILSSMKASPEGECSGGDEDDFTLVLDCCDLSIWRVEEVDVSSVPGLGWLQQGTGQVDHGHKWGWKQQQDLSLQCSHTLSLASGGELLFHTDPWSLQVRKRGIQSPHLFPRGLRIWYQTKPEGASVRWTKDQSGRACVYTIGSPINNRALFPCQEPPIAMSTWQARVRAPSECVVLLSGENKAHPVIEDAGFSHWDYYVTMPMPASTFTIAVGCWTEVRAPSSSGGEADPASTAEGLAETMGPSAEPVGPSAETMGPSAEPVGPSAETMGPSNEPVGPSAEPVGPSAEPVGPSAETMGPSAEPVGPSAETMGPSNEPSRVYQNHSSPVNNTRRVRSADQNLCPEMDYPDLSKAEPNLGSEMDYPDLSKVEPNLGSEMDYPDLSKVEPNLDSEVDCYHVDYPCRFPIAAARVQAAIPHRVFTPPSLQQRAQVMLLPLLARCLAAAHSLLGVHPFARLDILVVPAEFSSLGMASPHIVFLSQSVLTGDKQLCGSRLCHEIAHAWFGLAIGARDWTEEWISEGFATYLEDVFWARAQQLSQKKAEEQTQLKALLRWRRLCDELQNSEEELQILRPSKESTGNVSESGATLVKHALNPGKTFMQVHYLKGYFLLKFLSGEVGEERFLNFLRLFVFRHHGNLILSQDFLQTFLETFPEIQRQGLTVDDIYSDWLDSPGIPKPLSGRTQVWTGTPPVEEVKQEVVKWIHFSRSHRKGSKRKRTGPKVNFKEVTPEQLVLLLELLLDEPELSVTALRTLEKTYSLLDQDAEVRHRWCELVVKHKHSTAYRDVEHFLIHDQAMGVYLYGELMVHEDPRQQALAHRCFSRAKDQMDPAARRVVEEMIF